MEKYKLTFLAHHVLYVGVLQGFCDLSERNTITCLAKAVKKTDRTCTTQLDCFTSGMRRRLRQLALCAVFIDY